MNTHATQNADEQMWEMVHHATIFDWMERNQVAVLTVQFNGEGDSGSFEDYVETSGIDGVKLDYDALQESLEKTLITPRLAGSSDNSLKGLIMGLSEKYEEKTDHGIDWYNNEGGRGQVEWILDGKGSDGRHYKRGVCLTVEARVIEYEGESFALFGAQEDEGQDETETDPTA